MFTTEQESHEHSLQTLEQLNEHYEFKTSVSNVLDIGCGRELLDLKYWANMTDEFDENNPGRRLNIDCVGLNKILIGPPAEKNISVVQHDFNTEQGMGKFKKKFDVVWCHDVMQYSWSPLWFLNHVNKVTADGGMLYLCVPSTINTLYHRFESYTKSEYFSTFTITQLIYLLALNGFDTKDFYIKKEPYTDRIEVMTYKVSKPLDYSTTWYQLMEKDLLTPNMGEIIFQKGYLTNQGLVTTWIDGTVFDYRYEN